jgi:TfoX/Sxy family transcriptional regulator of competence genes
MEKWIKPGPELIDLYENIASQLAGIEKRKMFGCPCAFVNGNMFFGVFQDQLFLRMGENLRQYLSEDIQFEPMAPMGRIMKEYVLIPPDLRTDPVRLLNLVQKSLIHALSLPPKIKKK